MLGRKKHTASFLDDAGSENLVSRDGFQEQQYSAEPSAKKTFSEGSSLGIFRRGKQYDELLDDATSSSPPSGSKFINGHTSASLSDGETDSARTGSHTAIQGQRTNSGSLAEGVISKLSIKEKRVMMPMSYSPIGGLGKGTDEPDEPLEPKIHTPLPKSDSLSRKNGKTPAARTARGSSAAKTTPLAKKSRLQSSEFESFDNESISSADKSIRDEGTPSSDVAAAKPATPGRTPEHATPIARSSPGLMSTAAKFAASIHQGSRRALTRKNTGEQFSLMDDSAAEADPEPKSPGGGSSSEGVNGAASAAKGVANSRKDGSKTHRSESASPGAMRPLLDSGDSYGGVATSRSPLPGNALSHSVRSCAQEPSQLPGRPPVPRSPTPLAWKPALSHTPPHAHRVAVDSGCAQDGVAAEKAYDIFEPRPDSAAAVADTPYSARPQKLPAASPSIADISKMRGHDALKTLQRGSTLRKKWVNSTSAAEAAQAPKTERLIRCRIEGGRVVLHYHHQGVKGLLDKDEVVTHVQRVEVLDGPWRRGDCILLHTGRGVLALEAPDAAMHATWMLGLNAALFSTQTRGKEVLLEAPVRAIPRNSMFVVTPQ